MAQVTDLTVGGTVEAGDLFRVTIGGKYCEVAATTTSTTTTATEIYTALAALSASLFPEFAEVTWTNPSAGVVRATGVNAGVPVTITPTTTESNGSAADAQTFTGSTTTAATGPNHWDNTANWSSGTLPVDTDDVIITNTNVSILYGLAQSAVDLNSLRIFADFTGTIGLPFLNPAGYTEYRSRDLAISFGAAKVLTIGEADGPGSPRLRFNVGASVLLDVRVLKTAFPQVIGELAVHVVNDTNSISVDVSRGSVGIAADPGTTAILLEARIGFASDPSSDAIVEIGRGCVSFDAQMTGGIVQSAAGLGNLIMYGGHLRQTDGALSDVEVYDGARIEYLCADTITTLVLGNGGSIDFSQDSRGRTVTNCSIKRGGELHDPAGSVTFTNPVAVEDSDDMVFDVGKNRTLAVA